AVHSSTRRQFLTGTVGLAGGVAIGVAEASRPSPRPPGHGGRVLAAATRLAGVTVTPQTYGLGNWAATARHVDSMLGLPGPSAMQKAYFAEPPLSAGAKLRELAAIGCQFLLCVQPSTHLAAAGQARLRQSIAALTSAGIQFRVILWQEMTLHTRVFTRRTWQAYWAHYAPVCQAGGVPVDYNPACSSAPAAQRGAAWFPVAPLPDGLRMDYYGSGFARGSRLGALVAKAASLGVPAGLGEWGYAIHATLTRAQWRAYCGYLTGLAPQLALGGVYYGSAHLGYRGNVVESAADFKVPGIRAVSQALAGQAITATTPQALHPAAAHRPGPVPINGPDPFSGRCAARAPIRRG